MADISADELLPNGEFKATTCTGVLKVNSGASGTLFTANSSGGRKIRLTLLSVYDGTPQSGVTVTADGVAVVNSLLLSSNPLNVGGFSVGSGGYGAGVVAGLIGHIEAQNTITVTKSGGATSADIIYALEQGF